MMDTIGRRRFMSLTAGALAAGALTRPPAGRSASSRARPRTGLVYDPRYLEHSLGRGHPESPARLRAVIGRVEISGLLDDLEAIEPSADPLPAIRRVHPREHVRQVARQAGSESICRLAAAGALSAVDAVCDGRVRNAFCAVRPPGHHAADTGAFGFCFYNNVAVAARHAMRRHGAKRVLIVDWDYHHGNGTEWAFYDDPAVLFFSTHRLAAFPGTGWPGRRGEGDGKGYNINAPLPRGADDGRMLAAFEKDLLPAAERFEPDLVLISAGFDSRKDDLLGDFAVTDDGFARLTRLMTELAGRHAGGRLVSVLEGGYDVQGLALAVESHLQALLAA